MSATETAPAPAITNKETEPYIEKGGVFWYTPSSLNVRDVAGAMNAVGARFITITAYELPVAEGFRLEYHWDLGGLLLGFNFPLSGNVEVRYDAEQKRVVYQPVSIVPRVLVPKVIRHDHRYDPALRDIVPKELQGPR